jgi:DNA invertase Pin-like site-specific DNA recombinase
MKTIGYIRVSTDKQDLEKQKYLLWEYAQKQQLQISEFIEVEISSRKNTEERRIDELLQKLQAGDMLLVTELSRLGRNMLETMNFIHDFSEKGVDISFIRQPELSTTGPQAKLLLAVYSYLAETERDWISDRTKSGLAAARAKGKLLGRPEGSKNKERVLDPYRGQIKNLLEMGVSLASITKIVNNQLERPITYNSFKYFVQHDEELAELWQTQSHAATGKAAAEDTNQTI